MIDFLKLKPGTLVKVLTKTSNNDLNRGLLIGTKDKILYRIGEYEILFFCGIFPTNDSRIFSVDFMYKSRLLYNRMRAEDINECCNWLEIL